MFLPQASNTVGIKRLVIAEDREALRLCLGDQHAIKRIFVRSRQQTCAHRMIHGDGQTFKALTRKISCEVSEQITCIRQLSDPELGCDLPGRSGAYENGVARTRK